MPPFPHSFPHWSFVIPIYRCSLCYMYSIVNKLDILVRTLSVGNTNITKMNTERERQTETDTDTETVRQNFVTSQTWRGVERRNCLWKNDISFRSFVGCSQIQLEKICSGYVKKTGSSWLPCVQTYVTRYFFFFTFQMFLSPLLLAEHFKKEVAAVDR